MADAAGESKQPTTPIPVPEHATELVLFGGSFDPPTIAHSEVANRARRAVAPGAWLVFVPAARSPFKAEAPTADRHRMSMLGLVARAIDRAAVWTDEVDRGAGGGGSYWVETLRRARRARPGARLWFIIGADQAVAFDRWREAREVLCLATPIVLPRGPVTSVLELHRAQSASGAWSEAELDAWSDWFVRLPLVRGSATRARETLGDTGSRELATEMVAPQVLAYIEAQGLYR